MQVIDEKMQEEVLKHYPVKEHALLKNQIKHFNSFISTHIMHYQYSQDFRKAVDLMLTDLLSGKLLGRDTNET
jgi:hypothetical protein